ncbi:MAG: alkaline phosphatase family protein, partial [Flavisolibacter sp.]
MANISDQVKTVILVMMENRSFDHMLGHMTLDDPGLKMDGLRSESMPGYRNDYEGELYPVYELTTDQELDFDVPHEFTDVATQLQRNDVTGKFTMHGFVQAYANAGHIPNPQCIPMAYFPSKLVPITNFFARNFCSCDRWFAPIPTSTQPNRTMALCGDTEIFRTHLQLIPIGLNLFDWMEANGIRWKVYHDGFSFFALYNKLWKYVLGPGFKRFSEFHSDQIRDPTNSDPEVIIIEPCYADAPHLGTKHPNDNHAPLAIGWGEDFLRQVYLAVTANQKRWENTVMILYYDEHGGFFDHAVPPDIQYRTTGNSNRLFTSLGPRIPGLIISPFVQPGSVFSKLLDHTSILQFLAEKFTPGKSFSKTVNDRMAKGIQSISEIISEQPKRPIPRVPSVKINVQTALGKYIPVSQPTMMEQSFANAANELLRQKPLEAMAKYPELAGWK